MTLQPDGKIIIGGSFGQYNGVPRVRIARINADGSLDTTFDPGSGFTVLNVRALTLQADGKIVVVGGFDSYNGTPRIGIARININGTLDTVRSRLRTG